MRICRTWPAILGFIVLVATFVAFSKRSERPFVPKFGVGFQGYTAGVMGKRLALISITNISSHAVRLWPAPKVDYAFSRQAMQLRPVQKIDLSPALPMGKGYFQGEMLSPQSSVTGIVELITDPGSRRPMWRLQIQAYRLTRRERLGRMLADWANQHGWENRWTWVAPGPSYKEPVGTFASDWLGSFGPDRNATNRITE